MKKKLLRALSIVLCVATITTSNGFSALAAAYDNNDGTVEVNLLDALQEIEDEAASDNDAETVSDDDAEAASENEAINEAGDEAKAEETAPDNEAGETVSDNEADETVSDNDAETVSDNDAMEAVSDNDAEETVSDNEAEETVSDNEADEDTVSENALDVVVTDVLTINSDGELEIVGGYTARNLPLEIKKADIVALVEASGNELTVIPAGIFTTTCPTTSLYIPKTVETIEARAFRDDSNIKEIEFEIGSALTEIKEGTFKNCTKLESITITANVTSIGEEAFEGCSALYAVAVREGCLVESIGTEAFMGCSKLQTLQMDNMNNLETIGYKAFSGCKILFGCYQKSTDGFVFPSTLRSIGQYAFEGCDALSIVDMSNCIDLTLDVYAFALSGLIKVEFSPSTMIIPTGAFSQCANLGKNNTVITIGGDGYGAVLIEEMAFEKCTGLRTIVIENSVSEIKANAFSGCSSLEKVTIYSGHYYQNNGADVILYPNSLPINSGLTVYGYGGTVQEWQAQYKNSGVRYVSLFPKYPVKVPDYTGKGGKLTALQSQVSIGDTIQIKVECEAGYELLSITANNEQLKFDSTTKKATADVTDAMKKVDLTVKDTGYSVPITAVFVKKTDIKRSNFELVIEASDEGISWSPSARVLTFGSSCTNAPIIIRDISTGKIVGNWAWNFKSGDTKYVTVGANGTVTAVKKTPSNITITATLKSDPQIALSFYVCVEERAVLDHIDNFAFGRDRVYEAGSVARRINGTYFYTYTDDELNVNDNYNYQVLRVSSAYLKEGKLSIPVIVEATNTMGTAVEGGYSWSVLDTNVATFANANSTSNANTLVIKGAGNTIVTAKSNLANELGGKPSRKFILRVVDMTPVIDEKSISMNSAADNNSAIALHAVPMYGTTINHESKFVLYTKTENNTYVKEKSTFEITYAGDNLFTIKLKPEAKKLYTDPKKDYILKNYYLRMEVVEDVSTQYYVKMPDIHITAKNDKPSVSVNGAINTFYMQSDDTKPGTVKIVLTPAKGFKLDPDFQVELKSLSTDVARKFENNFEVSQVMKNGNITVVVKQKPEVLEVDKNNKPVVKGYLVVKNYGCTTQLLDIKIPTVYTKPQYTLSKVKVTTNINTKGQEFTIQLLDQNTKKVIDLTDNYVINYDGIKCGPTFSGGYLKPEIDYDNDTIKIVLPEGIKASEDVYIDVNHSHWNLDTKTPLKYLFRINVTTAAPKITFDKSPLVINTSVETYATMGYTYNQIPSVDHITFSEFMPLGNKTTKPEAEKLTLKWDDDDNPTLLRVSFDRNNVPVAGTYSFRATPKVYYANTGATEYMDPVTVKVRIMDGKPAMVLKKTTINLNSTLAGLGIEYPMINYSWVNLDQGEIVGYVPDVTNAVLVWKGVEYTSDEWSWDNDSACPISVKFEMGPSKPRMVIRMNSVIKGNQAFEIRRMTIGNAVVKKLKFTVNCINKAPVLKLTPSGTLDVLQDSSKILYKVSVSNFNGQIFGEDFVVTSETNEAREALNKEEITDESQFHFIVKAKADFSTSKTLVLKVDPTKGDDPEIGHDIENRMYALTLDLAFRDYNGDIKYKLPVKIVFKPVQKMPALKVSIDRKIYYMGGFDLERTVNIEKTTNQHVQIIGIKWDPKLSNTAMRDGFYEPELIKDQNGIFTGEIKLRIKNPALLKKGTTYELPFRIICKNQLLETEGKKFIVKIKMQ